eukprot:TRINITY_DN13669_c0_g1_i1.p1 TRINITY_DN13669_c0_g1~~TRINITY_DN13669_c0_g1_i1.p1  ORF type:complete len:771 (-),score=140.62 TRINITY_DN13669_c0_g1_i1:299-2611(-)
MWGSKPTSRVSGGGGYGAAEDMRSRASSNVQQSMEVVSCPSEDLALTNFAFVSRSDLPGLAEAPGVLAGFADVSGTVLTVKAHDSIAPGTIGLNSAHRQSARVSVGEKIPVTRFSPPQSGFDLVVLTVSIEYVSKAKARADMGAQLDAEALSNELKRRFLGQVFNGRQKVGFEHVGTKYSLVVSELLLARDGEASPAPRGRLAQSTAFIFEASSGIKIVNQKGGKGMSMFKSKEFNFEKLGIGGLDRQFEDIFRRAFASRVFPPHIVNKLGIQHVKGVLLWGPPGTGKTLIARQLGKALNGKEPKVVNGPEILDKYVGASEENVRKLFADAEKDQKEKGDDSELHVIIFDEIDAICKSRGSTRDGTGVHDSIVNQLLTKIDGVDALNNILLIGMTNRKDMLDEALLRPGRLEVQIEIGLPDEEGRFKILQIHSSKMKENSFLARDVDLPELAKRTRNFSGAELEGLIKSAASFALKRHVDPSDLSKPLDEENVKVTMGDFDSALFEVRPAFGANVNQLESYRMKGMMSCLTRHTHILETALRQVDQIRGSDRSPLLTCLLEGESGSGKTALAATIAINSQFPFVKLISADTLLNMSEYAKCQAINKAFDDAYKSALSVIILDDIERLLEYVSIGPRFSNLVLQTILVLVKRPPPTGRKVFVVGTTGLPDDVMRDLHLTKAFTTVLSVPTLASEDIRAVLQSLNVFTPPDVESAVEALQSAVRGLGEEMTIRRLLMLIEMAAQASGGAAAVHSGKQKIDLTSLYDCLQDLS